jgi:hypothetical protein
VFFYACAQCSSILLVSSWLLRKIQYMQGSSGFNTWREVLPLESVRGSDGARPARPAPTSQRPPSRYPADLYGKCFNCLSIAHRVATCRLPPHCLRCKGFRHLTRDCKQRRKVTFGAPDGRSRCLVQEPTPGNRPRAQGGAPDAIGVGPGTDADVPGAATCGDSGRKRWRRRQRRPRRKGVASRRQRVSPLTATAVRPGPPKRRQAPPRVRPCFASLCLTRLWRRCARARALRHWSSPSTQCWRSSSQSPPGNHGDAYSGGCPLASAVGVGAGATHSSYGGSSRCRLRRRGRPTRDRGDDPGCGCPLASAVGAGVGDAHASSGGSAQRRE